MRNAFIPPFLAAALLLAACDRPPTEPAPSQSQTPQFSATHDEWVQDLGFLDNDYYVACANDGAGEYLHLYGQVWADMRSVTTASGEVRVKGRAFLDQDFIATGLTSGDVWSVDVDKSKSNYLFVGTCWPYAPTPPQECPYSDLMEHGTVNYFFTNQDGEKLHLHHVVGFVVDENGQLRWIRLSLLFFGCPGQH